MSLLDEVDKCIFTASCFLKKTLCIQQTRDTFHPVRAKKQLDYLITSPLDFYTHCINRL